MTGVDFYILGDAGDEPALRTACRLTEKAWGQGLRVYVLLRTDDQATRLDDMLWTFQQDNFIAHERWHGAGDAHAMTDTLDDDAAQPMRKSMTESTTTTSTSTMARVLIGTTAQPPRRPELLINLGAPLADWFAQCPQVIEVVAGDAQSKAAGRERYRAYREQGVQLRTHEV